MGGKEHQVISVKLDSITCQAFEPECSLFSLFEKEMRMRTRLLLCDAIKRDERLEKEITFLIVIHFVLRLSR